MKKTALITGASSGIGKEFAIIHAERGGDLVVVARRLKELTKLKKELENKFNCQVKVIDKDLSRPNAAKEIYNQLKKSGIQIDYLINNAGFGGGGKFYERSWEKDLAMINLNIVTLAALTRYILPDLVERNSGKILNVSSVASLMAGPLQAVYYATKAFVTSFSNAIAEELRDTNVTVTTLLPGATETEFAKTSNMDKAEIFQKAKTFDALEVALAGYNGMMAGKLDVFAGLTFSQRLLLKTIPLIPKKILMSQIRKMQEIR